MTTILNNEKVIKTIYQISDIHIPLNDNIKMANYERIFNNLYSKINNTSNENSIIILCGDIFHAGLSNQNLMMAKDLFINLSNICDLIIITGNHDLVSKNNDNLNHIKPVLYKLMTKNKIYHLIKEGEYIYGNLIFGLTTMFSKKVYTIQNGENKIKIGLYHGQIHGSKTNNHVFTNTGLFNVSNFDSYDYVLLGDIHQYQTFRPNKTMAYSSSLIQQNFGEYIDYHGFIKWNLENKTHLYFHIENEYCYLTIIFENNKKISPDKLDNLPKYINLRIIHKNTDMKYITKMCNDIKKKYTIVSISYINKNTSIINTNNSLNSDTLLYKNKDEIKKSLIDYISKHIDNYESKQKKINDKIEHIIKNEIEYNYEKMIINFEILKIKFNNFNVFDENNFINYENLNGIITINNKNGVGKSTICVYVLLYALFGTENKHCINSNKTELYTEINFKINNICYKITRDYHHNKKIVTGITKIYKNNNEIHTGRTEQNIKTYIENEILHFTQQDFIDYVIMDQKKCVSFLDKSPLEKKNYFFSIFKLDVFNDICSYLAKEIKLLKDRNNLLYNNNNKYDYTALIKLNNDIIHKAEILNNKQKHINELYLEHYNKKILLENKINEINENSKNQINKKHKYIQNSQLIENIKKEINKLNLEIKNKTNELDMIMLNNKNIDINSLDNKINNIQKNINEKWKMYDNSKYVITNNDILYDKIKCNNDIIINKKQQLTLLINNKNNMYENILNEYNEFLNNNNNKIQHYQNLINLTNIKHDVIDEYNNLEKSNNDLIDNNKNLYKLLDNNNNKITYSEYITLIHDTNNLELELKYMIKQNDLINKIINITKNINRTCRICINNKKLYDKIQNEEYNKNNIGIYEDKIRNNKIIINENKKYFEGFNEIDNIKKNNENDIIKYKIDKNNLLIEYNNKKIDLIKKDINEKQRYDDIINKINEIKNKKYEKYELYKTEEEQINILTNEINTINKENEDIENEIKENNKKMDIINNNTKIESEINNNNEEIEKIKLIKKGYITFNENINSINMQINSLIIQRETFIKKISILEIENENYKKDNMNNDDINELEKEYIIIDNKTTEYKTILDKYENEIWELNNELIITKTKIETINETNNKITDISNRINLYTEIHNIIESGFINSLFMNIINTIEDNINNTLKIYANFSIKIKYEKDKFEIFKIDDNNKLSLSSRLSGYENMILNLTFRLIFNKYNCVCKINFMVLDEVFSYCDSDNKTKIESLLNYMETLYKFILIITHDDQLKTYGKREINIKQNNNYSHIEIE